MEKNSFFSIDPIEKIKITNKQNSSIELQESNSIIIPNSDNDISNNYNNNKNFKSEVNLLIKEDDNKTNKTNETKENNNIPLQKLKHYGNNFPLLFNKYGEPIIVIGPHCK